MKQINEYTTDELSAKIEAIKAERERTADALKRYEEELERRKQEVPLGVPTVGKFCLTYDGHVTNFLNNKQKPEDYNFNIFHSEESAEKQAEMLLAWRKALVANSKGEPIDIKVLLPLLPKGHWVACDSSGEWFVFSCKPFIRRKSGVWDSEWHDGFRGFLPFNLKPAEDWQNSLMECGL